MLLFRFTLNRTSNEIWYVAASALPEAYTVLKSRIHSPLKELDSLIIAVEVVAEDIPNSSHSGFCYEDPNEEKLALLLQDYRKLDEELAEERLFINEMISSAKNLFNSGEITSWMKETIQKRDAEKNRVSIEELLSSRGI